MQNELIDNSSKGTNSNSNIIKIDFNNIEIILTDLNKAVTKIDELIDSYIGEIEGLSNTSAWEGTDKEELIDSANGYYLRYLYSVLDSLKILISQLEYKKEQYEDVENSLASLTI